LRLAYQWIDALWVRGLGVDATAAVTTSVFVMWWMYSSTTSSRSAWWPT